ncbi:MAG: hypothetical protein JNJ89_13005 [Rubrivivax sp.]|nr:hypothetical protein [Rubrivivax sp.]
MPPGKAERLAANDRFEAECGMALADDPADKARHAATRGSPPIAFGGPGALMAVVKCVVSPRHLTDVLTLIQGHERWQIISRSFTMRFIDRSRRRWAAALGLAAALGALLGACGGNGGGAGDAGGGEAFRATLQTTRVDLRYREDQTPFPVPVVVTWSGTPPSPLFLGAQVSGTGIDPGVGATLSATEAEFRLVVRTGLAPGSYSGEVRLLACSDAACTRPVGGSPLVVPYTLTVTPMFRVSPVQQTVNAVSGQGGQAELQISLPEGVSTAQVTVLEGADFMVPGTLASGRLPITLRPWRSGSWTGRVQVSDGTLSISTFVHYLVVVGPGGETNLTVNPLALAPTAAAGASAAPLALTVQPPSWLPADAPIQASITYLSAQTGWLQLTRTATGFNVVASAAGLPPGRYSASILLDAGNASQPQQVGVTFDVL